MALARAVDGVKRAAVFLACAVLLSGCWGGAELENRAYISAIGADGFRRGAGADLFENNKGEPRYVISASVAAEGTLRGEGGDDSEAALIAAAGETVPGAFGLFGLQTSRKPYFGHLKAVVLGSGVLSDAALLAECADALERNREVGRNVIVTATDGDARDILEAKGEGEPLFGMYMSRVYKNRDSVAGAAFRLNLEDLAASLSEDGSAVIPRVSVRGDAVRLGGAALIKDCKLAGWLDDGQTRGVLWVRGQGEGARVQVRHAGGYYPVAVSRQRASMSFREQDGRLVCGVEVRAQAVLEGQDVKKGDDHEPLAAITVALERQIGHEMEDGFEAMRVKGVDGFAVRRELAALNPALYEKWAADWDAAYRDMRFEPTARVRIGGAGGVRF